MIRTAKESDLPRIAEIHADAWHHAYADIIPDNVMQSVTPASRLLSWSEWFIVDAYHISVYLEDDTLAGFILTCPARDVADPPLNYGELTHLYLDPKYIGRGIGHHLFQEAVTQIQAQGWSGMLLWVLEHNSVARQFYESHDMKADGARLDDPQWLGPEIYEVRYRVEFAER